MRFSRRDFVQWFSGGLGAAVFGCDQPSTAGAGGSPERGIDSGDENEDAGQLLTRAVTKGPWVQLQRLGTARIRFETRVDEAVACVIRRGGEQASMMPTRVVQTIDYERPPFGPGSIPDEAGTYVMHELVLSGLGPAERVGWSVRDGEGTLHEGEFLAPVAAETPFRFAWIADTSFPFADVGIARLASEAPDFVLHGGDITYQPNPLDSWNLAMKSFAPLMRRAAMHFAVGNHEFERGEEITAQFDRLFVGQGVGDSAGRFHAVTYGAIRFLFIDTESGELTSMDEPQLAWIDEELEAVDADAQLRFAIAIFHRPTYTLSKHSPGDTRVRELLHERFVRHGVPLVLAGHVHAYEHFLVDDVHYVIDGGGGAALYDPNEERESTEVRRPGETALRLAAIQSRGGVVVDVDRQGALRVRRLEADEMRVSDEFMIPSV